MRQPNDHYGMEDCAAIHSKINPMESWNDAVYASIEMDMWNKIKENLEITIKLPLFQ